MNYYELCDLLKTFTHEVILFPSGNLFVMVVINDNSQKFGKVSLLMSLF